MTKFHENLGQRLRRLRKAAGITQIEAATEAGIARSHLSKIESSEYHPATWDAMVKLSDLYKVSLDYLRFGDSNSTNCSDAEFIKDSTEIAILKAFRVLNDDEKRAFAILINSKSARSVS